MSINAPIVVAVDGSEQALAAVRWATTAAARHRRPLRIVSAMPPFAPQFTLSALSLEDAAVRAARKFAEESITTAGEMAAEIAPDLQITGAILEGKPALVLRDVSSRAHMLVVGRRGLSGVRGLLMGSVSTDAAAHADCPVVVVTGDDYRPDGPVVVGVDGSPVSTAAIAEAFRQASVRDTRLIAVHTYGGFSEAAFYSDDIDRVLTQLREEAAEALGSQLAGYREEHPDVTVEPVVREGGAAESIRELSHDAQLVVMGSRGRGGFRGLVLGSTSQAVLHVAHCPVMVVHSA
ncbi:universal stress protein [Gordonia shandongensis]|uniref:universal stress protein n=1 Tax=Gordonia shandongensis TaxID=376351 RepID=UPI00047B68C7|nr:universal stress protein [Gordonia shandongensis]